MLRRQHSSPSSKRRGCFGRVILWMAVGLLVIAGGTAYLWTSPIRAEWVHEQLVSRLRQASGVNVTYDSAAFDLPHSIYTFRNLRFTDPKQQQELLSFGSLTVGVRPLALLFGRASVIREIEISQPGSLDLRYDRTGIHLGPRLAFLARMIRRGQPAPSGSSHANLPMDKLRIRDAKISFDEVTTAPGAMYAEARPAAILVGDILARSVSGGALIADFEGTGFTAPDTTDKVTGRPIASGLKATAQFKRGKNSDTLELSGSVASASLGGLFSNLPGTGASSTDLEFDVRAERFKTNTNLELAFAVAGLDVTSAEHGVDIHDENVQGRAAAQFDIPQATLHLEDAQLSSGLVSASAGGQISLDTQHSYDIKLAASRLDAGYRKLLTRFLPRGWNITAQPEGVIIDTAIGGSVDGLASVRGQLLFNGVSITAPHLQRPVTGLNGSIQLSTETLTVHNLSGRHGDTSMTLSGEIAGDFLRKREGQINLAWKTSSTPDDLLALVALEQKPSKTTKANPKATKPKSRGVISGTGTYQQFVSLADMTRTLPPQVDGTVQIQGAGFTHPSLPAPVEDLNGSMHIEGDRLLIDSLSGNLRDSKVTISGMLKGQRVFWHEPAINADVTTKLDLAQMVTYLPAEQKQIIMKNRIRGEATTKLTLSGSLKQLGDATFAGSVQLRNVAFAPSLQFMAGEFTNMDGEVQWDGNSLILKELTGKLNNEPIHATGMLSQDALALNLDGAIDLSVMPKTFTQLDKWLVMSGPAKYDVKFSIGDTAAAAKNEPSPLPVNDEGVDTSGNRLVSLFGQLSSRIEESVASKQHKLTGKVEFQGANMRHRAMPMERKEQGKSIPRGEVLNMRGTALIENDTFRISDDAAVTCDFADTRNCQLSGSLKLRENDLPKMTVAIRTKNTLRLDSWITGWGTELDKPPQPPQTGKSFDLDAIVTADSIIYKQQRAGQSRANINFKMTQDNTPRRTTFEEVIIQNAAGPGSLKATGYIDSFVWDTSRFPRWESNVENVDRMQLQPLLTAVFKEPTNLQGLVQGGTLRVGGVGNDAQSISGSGSVALTNLVIGRTTVFQQMGQKTGRAFGERLFQTASAARFDIGNGALSAQDLKLLSNGISMELRGDYYFAGNRQRGIPEKTIDGRLKINFLESMFRGIPLIGDVAKLADQVAGQTLFEFRISGNADRPQITPVLVPILGGALPIQ